MVAHNQKLKIIEFSIDGTRFECQVNKWNIANNTEDGEQFFTFCADGAFRELTDPDYALEVTFFADWRSAGISDFLTTHDGQTVTFQLDHHPDIPAEHVRWTGSCLVKAPNVGGDARATEQTETTLQIIDKPTYTRI